MLSFKVTKLCNDVARLGWFVKVWLLCNGAHVVGIDTHQRRQFSQQRSLVARGPMATFAATVLIAFAALAVTALALPKDFALAAVSTLFFAFAALLAVIAWRLGQPKESSLSYWDVAGVLTLFGIFAATLMDADQLVRLIDSQRTAD
jgi:hypothetical protein